MHPIPSGCSSAGPGSTPRHPRGWYGLGPTSPGGANELRSSHAPGVTGGSGTGVALPYGVRSKKRRESGTQIVGEGARRRRLGRGGAVAVVGAVAAEGGGDAGRLRLRGAGAGAAEGGGAGAVGVVAAEAAAAGVGAGMAFGAACAIELVASGRGAGPGESTAADLSWHFLRMWRRRLERTLKRRWHTPHSYAGPRRALPVSERA
jgi:hypothetical protein